MSFFLTLYLFMRTYRKALEQVLKMSVTFSRQASTLFSMFCMIMRAICGAMLARVWLVLCFIATKLRELFEQTLSEIPHRKEMSDMLWPVNRGSQISREQCPQQRTLTVKQVLTVWVVAPPCGY